MQTTTKQQAIEMAQQAMQLVEQYVREGLPPPYSNFEDFLGNFYDMLPCDEAPLVAALQHILESGKYAPTFKRVRRRFQHDFEADLRSALRDARAALAERAVRMTSGPNDELIFVLRPEFFFVEDHGPEPGKDEPGCDGSSASRGTRAPNIVLRVRLMLPPRVAPHRADSAACGVKEPTAEVEVRKPQGRKVKVDDFKWWFLAEQGAFPDEEVDRRLTALLHEVGDAGGLLERAESLAKRYGTTFEVVITALRAARKGDID